MAASIFTKERYYADISANFKQLEEDAQSLLYMATNSRMKIEQQLKDQGKEINNINLFNAAYEELGVFPAKLRRKSGALQSEVAAWQKLNVGLASQPSSGPRDSDIRSRMELNPSMRNIAMPALSDAYTAIVGMRPQASSGKKFVGDYLTLNESTRKYYQKDVDVDESWLRSFKKEMTAKGSEFTYASNGAGGFTLSIPEDEKLAYVSKRDKFGEFVGINRGRLRKTSSAFDEAYARKKAQDDADELTFETDVIASGNTVTDYERGDAATKARILSEVASHNKIRSQKQSSVDVSVRDKMALGEKRIHATMNNMFLAGLDSYTGDTLTEQVNNAIAAELPIMLDSMTNGPLHPFISKVLLSGTQGKLTPEGSSMRTKLQTMYKNQTIVNSDDLIEMQEQQKVDLYNKRITHKERILRRDTGPAGQRFRARQAMRGSGIIGRGLRRLGVPAGVAGGVGKVFGAVGAAGMIAGIIVKGVSSIVKGLDKLADIGKQILNASFDMSTGSHAMNVSAEFATQAEALKKGTNGRFDLMAAFGSMSQRLGNVKNNDAAMEQILREVMPSMSGDPRLSGMITDYVTGGYKDTEGLGSRGILYALNNALRGINAMGEQTTVASAIDSWSPVVNAFDARLVEFYREAAAIGNKNPEKKAEVLGIAERGLAGTDEGAALGELGKLFIGHGGDLYSAGALTHLDAADAAFLELNAKATELTAIMDVMKTSLTLNFIDPLKGIKEFMSDLVLGFALSSIGQFLGMDEAARAQGLERDRQRKIQLKKDEDFAIMAQNNNRSAFAFKAFSMRLTPEQMEDARAGKIYNKPRDVSWEDWMALINYDDMVNYYKEVETAAHANRTAEPARPGGINLTKKSADPVLAQYEVRNRLETELVNARNMLVISELGIRTENERGNRIPVSAADKDRIKIAQYAAEADSFDIMQRIAYRTVINTEYMQKIASAYNSLQPHEQMLSVDASAKDEITMNLNMTVLNKNTGEKREVHIGNMKNPAGGEFWVNMDVDSANNQLRTDVR